MMLLTAVTLASISAFAADKTPVDHVAANCPKLAGTYNCKGEVKDFSYDSLVIEQTDLADGEGQSYWLPKTATGAENVYKREANGKSREHDESNSHIGKMKVTQLDTCLKNGTLMTSDVSALVGDDGSTTPFVTVTNRFKISPKGAVTVQQTMIQEFGGETSRVKSKSVCTPATL